MDTETMKIPLEGVIKYLNKQLQKAKEEADWARQQMDAIKEENESLAMTTKEALLKVAEIEAQNAFLRGLVTNNPEAPETYKHIESKRQLKEQNRVFRDEIYRLQYQLNQLKAKYNEQD